MRKALTILTGLLIAGMLSLYILDLNPFKPVNKSSIAASDMNIIRLGENIESENSPLTERVYGNAVKSGLSINSDKKSRADLQNSVQVNSGSVIGGWKLVWSDDFDEQSINTDYWTEVYNVDNYNNELQSYLPENSYIKNGSLCLTAKKVRKGEKDYSSAMVQTMNKLTLCYGRIEAKIKLPVGKGLFPAFWMLSEQEGEELDIMEMIGSEPYDFYGVTHYDNAGKRAFGTVKNKTPEDYHVYTLDWEPDGLKWYIDGKEFFETTDGVPSSNMYIIFTLAIGGDWPGAPDKSTKFPTSMLVDYIRIYKHA